MSASRRSPLARALLASIAHWRRLAGTTPGTTDAKPSAEQCALCRRRRSHPCGSCPICRRTGHLGCWGSPFNRAYDAFWDYYDGNRDGDRALTTADLVRWQHRALDEALFLESLGPEVETLDREARLERARKRRKS